MFFGIHASVQRICKYLLNLVEKYPHGWPSVDAVPVASKFERCQECVDQDRVFRVEVVRFHLRLHRLHQLGNVA